MIGSLRGTLLDRSGSELLIEVGGVGYRVSMAGSDSGGFEVGEEAFVHVHHHIREDAQSLFGFLTIDERQVFELLLSAHGVGPSMAAAILSTHRPDRLAQIVMADDLDGLCLVPGVGKKTAARLMIELKSKLGSLALDVGTPSVLPAGGTDGGTSAISDVQAALAELGYSHEEVRRAVVGLPTDADSAQLLRMALAALS